MSGLRVVLGVDHHWPDPGSNAENRGRFDGKALGSGAQAASFPTADPLPANWVALHADAAVKAHSAIMAACGMESAAARAAWLQGYKDGLIGAMESVQGFH